MAASVQVYPCKFRQIVSQSKANDDPIFKCGTKLVLALGKRFAKGNYSWQFPDFPSETAILQLVIVSQLHRCLNIGRERKRHRRSLTDQPKLASRQTIKEALKEPVSFTSS
jgi:hypothetical protein